MVKQEPIVKKKMNANAMTIMGLFTGLISIPFYFIPMVGAICFFFGMFALFTSSLGLFLKKRLKLSTIWPTIGLAISFIPIGLGLHNYSEHKQMTDFMTATPIGKVKAIIELDQKSKAHTKALKEDSGATTQNETLKDEESNNTTKNLKTKSKTEAPLDLYYYSVVDKLRIRANPKKESEVLGHLKFGDQVRYAGEKSDKKEKILLAGKMRNDYWYKVQSMGSYRKTGWVYGGALVNATEEKSVELKDKIVRTINFISNDSLITLIGRTGQINYTYCGLMSYHKGEQNNLKSNGAFNFIGLHNIDHSGTSERGSYELISGTTKNGKLDREYVNTVYVFEAWYDLKIIFDEGTCLSYFMSKNEEGDILETKSSNPEDCSFDYISDKLLYIN